MDHVNQIANALRSHGAVGVAALHETGGPSVIFTTECGKVFCVNFESTPSENERAAAAKAIEAATGLKIDWHGLTRGAEERAAAEKAARDASLKLSAEIEREAKPVDTQASHKAQLTAEGGR